MRILTVLATTAALAAPLSMPVAAQDMRIDPPGLITVTGEGRVDSRPDMATVTLGVETMADTANAALAENTGATQKVLEKLKASGIAARDIQTSNLTLGPRWDHQSGQAPKMAGFVASNMVTVTVRELNMLGGVLDAVVSNGANTFNGLSFGLTDPRPKQDEARRAAVADAMARAKLFADAAGVKLGPLQSLSEGGSYAPMPRFASAPMVASEAVPVAEGEVSVMANVTMVFRLAD